MDPISFTERELDVMAVLWEFGPSTVAEVRERLVDTLAYTTVLTVLRTLEAKGFVAHATEGKAHRFTALVDRDHAGRSALGRIVDKIFGGSRELVLTHLVDARGVDDAELRRLRKILNDRARATDGGR